jgi:DNA polymerase III subunit epsilon
MSEQHPLIKWMQDKRILPQRWGKSGDLQQAAYTRALLKDAQNRVPLDTPLYEMRYLVVDLETTGFQPFRGDEILSLGSVPVERGEMLDARLFYELVKPLKNIPPQISELTGITAETVQNVASIEAVLKRWLPQLQGVTLVAYGAKHDFNFLQAFFSKSLGVKLSNRILDAYQIVRWLHPDWASHTLDEAVAYYQIQPRPRHTADGDALMTAELWVKLLAEFAQREMVTLHDLYAALAAHS